MHIARQQSEMEDALARICNRVLICDTNAFATAIWHERYVGSPCPDVEAIAALRRYDLYLLTGDEVPFVQDGLRDGEHIRAWRHRRFEEALATTGMPWRLLRGSPSDRLTEAIGAINSLLAISPSPV